MRLKIFILIIFFIPKVVKSYEFLSTSMEHVPLMMDICKLYGIKSIIFLYAESIKEMEMTTMVFKWTRALSRESFATTNFYFSQLHRSSHYVGRILRPLYVSVISNYEAINEFSLATSTFDMSFAVWLVIFIYKGHGSDYCLSPPGNIFHLRFNSEMLVLCGRENILREWYSVDTNNTDIEYFATWNSQEGIVEMVQKSLYERRINLHGLVMNTVIVKDSTFLRVIDNEFEGVFGRVFSELCTALNFTLKVVAKVDDYGIYDPEKDTWSGAIGEIYSGHANISISDFSMTSSRLNAVDFSFPLFTSKNSLFFRQPHKFSIKWSTYFLTFTYPVWITIFVILTAASILIIFLKIKIRSNRDLMRLGSDSFLEVWGIFCQQGLEDFPGRTSLKIAYFSIFLFATVLSAAYSASLTSILTSATHTLPFSSLETFVKDGTYKLAVFHGSADYDSFTNSEQPLIKELMKFMIEKDKLPVTVLDAINLICEDDKLTVLIYNRIKDDLSIDLPCDVVSVNVGGVESLSIVLSKNNAFTDLINFHLQKFINNGMLNRLKDTTYKKKFRRPIKEHIAVSLNIVISLFVFVLIGIIISICILFVEKYVYAYKMNKELMVDLVPSTKSSELSKK